MRLLPLLFALSGAAAAETCPAPIEAGASDLGLSSFRQGDGQVSGAANDVLRELARRTGCPLEIAWYPRARLWAEYGSGRINLTVSAARTTERDRIAHFVPYVTTRFDLVLSRRLPGHYKTLAAFVQRSKARLTLVRGAYYAPGVVAQLERLRQQGRLEEVSDFEMVFRKIASARADATLAPMMIYLRYQHDAGGREMTTVMPVAESPPMLVGAYFSRRGLPPAARQAFADALLGMVADGSVARIYGRYVGEANARSLVPEHGRGIIAAYQPLP